MSNAGRHIDCQHSEDAVIDLRESVRSPAAAEPRPLPWDDPAYWPPLEDDVIELAAATFRKYLREARDAPSPRRRSPTGPPA